MTHLEDEFFLVLSPTKRMGVPINGQRPVRAFKAEKLTRNKPFTNRDEVAVRLKIALDSSLFDDIIPTIEVELGAKDLFINTKVEVLPQEEPDDEDVPG